MADQNTTTEPVKPSDVTGIAPEFGRCADVQRLFGLRRGTLYNLLSDGKIKGVLLRVRGSKTGVRLFDLQSVRQFIRGEMAAVDGEQKPGGIGTSMGIKAMNRFSCLVFALFALTISAMAQPLQISELAWKKIHAGSDGGAPPPPPPPPPPCTAYANPVAMIVVVTNTATSISLPGGNGAFSISENPTNGTLAGLNTTAGTVTYTETNPVASQDNFTYCVSNSPSCLTCAPVSIQISTNLLGSCFAVPLVGGVFNGEVVINTGFPYEYVCIAYTNLSCVRVTNCNDSDSNGVVSFNVQIGCGSSNFCVVDAQTNGSLGGYFLALDRLTNTVDNFSLVNNGGGNYFLVTRPTNGVVSIGNIVTGQATYTVTNTSYEATHTIGLSDFFTYTCASVNNPFTNIVPVYVYNEQWDSIHRVGTCLAVAPTNTGTMKGSVYYFDEWPYQNVTIGHTNGICDYFTESATGDGVSPVDVIRFPLVTMGCHDSNVCVVADCFTGCVPGQAVVQFAGTSEVNGLYRLESYSGVFGSALTITLTNIANYNYVMTLNVDLGANLYNNGSIYDLAGEEFYSMTGTRITCSSSDISAWTINHDVGDGGVWPPPVVTISNSFPFSICQ